MGDLITATCVLKRGGFEGPRATADCLSFVLLREARQNPDWHAIACHAKGTPEPDCGHPVWQYEVRDGRLHLTPSLLDQSTGFHTDYHWSVAFAECPDGRDPFTVFFELNPGMSP